MGDGQTELATELNDGQSMATSCQRPVETQQISTISMIQRMLEESATIKRMAAAMEDSLQRCKTHFSK